MTLASASSATIMNRDQPGNKGDSILELALETFAEFGYHGSTVREIARRRRVTVPAIYHYFPSKQSMLVELLNRVMDDLISTTQRAIEEAPLNPKDQLVAAVRAHIGFDIERPAECFIANSEIRSLEPPERKSYIAKRDRQERYFHEIVHRGTDEGVFLTPYPREVGRAIATLCSSVATWYRPKGGLSAEEIMTHYAAFALSLACFAEAGQPDAQIAVDRSVPSARRTTARAPKNTPKAQKAK
jgi:AcrR family transcriptional regulator